MKTKIFLVLIFLSFNLFATDNVSYKFVNIGSSAKALSLSEACVALPSDITSMDYNPASLAFINKNQLSLMHIEYFADFRYEYLGYGGILPQYNNLPFGINFKYFYSSPIEIIDLDGNSQGNISASDFALTIGTAKKFEIPDIIYAGANIKIFQSKLGDYSSYAFAFDIGAIKDLFYLKKPWRLGLVLRNVGLNIKKYAGESVLPPMNFAFGGSSELFKKDVHQILGSAESSADFKSKIKIKMGIEYSYNNFIFARLGYKIGSDTSSFSLGAGLKKAFYDVTILREYTLKEIYLSVDYALIPFSDLGLVHSFSLNFVNLKFGEQSLK